MASIVQHPQSNEELIEKQHKEFILSEIKALLTEHIAEIGCLPRGDHLVLSAAEQVSAGLERSLNDACSRLQIKNGVRARRDEKAQQQQTKKMDV